jgi:hypothetical protein
VNRLPLANAKTGSHYKEDISMRTRVSVPSRRTPVYASASRCSCAPRLRLEPSGPTPAAHPQSLHIRIPSPTRASNEPRVLSRHPPPARGSRYLLARLLHPGSRRPLQFTPPDPLVRPERLQCCQGSSPFEMGCRRIPRKLSSVGLRRTPVRAIGITSSSASVRPTLRRTAARECQATQCPESQIGPDSEQSQQTTCFQEWHQRNGRYWHCRRCP